MNKCILLLTFAATCLQLTQAEKIESSPDSEVFFDSYLKAIRKDGRDPSVRSVFEEVRLAFEAKDQGLEHPLLTNRKDGVDVDMDLLYDYGHTVSMKLGNATDTVELIPSTQLEDLILLHPKCSGCWSQHGTRWTPEVHTPIGATQTQIDIDFMFYMHFYQAKLTGHYWMTNVCLDSDWRACAINMIVYAVEKAEPWFHLLSDGYLGLAPFSGEMKAKSDSHNNAIEQMHFHKMMSKKVFGVHTHMYNSTEDQSQIRFGGYNQDLIREGHDLIWFNTSNKNAWSIELNSASLHDELFEGKTMHAVIDPAYPYMAMPKNVFAKFTELMMQEFPNEPVTCKGSDWCYFFTPCEQVASFIPAMTFSVTNTDGDNVELIIPSKSFLYTDVDRKTNLTTCHVGVIAQKYTDKDVWVLGQAFMENFYTVFDG